MKQSVIIQGRSISQDEIELIRRLIAENPSWNRTRLSKELCASWGWRNAKGQLKDMACRTLLLKLERAGYVTLPPPLRRPNNHLRSRSIQQVRHETAPIESSLRDRVPIKVVAVRELPSRRLFETLLSRYHYLGYTGSVGENMKYMVLDREEHALACLLFGSAAWRLAARDGFIGWDDQSRRARLHLITNNMRFLILPWVRVPHLASHILGRIGRRVSADWIEKYGHPIHLLETFIERGRFRGTVYQAANWIHVGETRGRSRNDRGGTQVPIKHIYLYPLTKHFREELCGVP